MYFGSSQRLSKSLHSVGEPLFVSRLSVVYKKLDHDATAFCPCDPDFSGRDQVKWSESADGPIGEMSWRELN